MARAARKPLPTTALRVAAAFVLVLGLFAAALAVTLRTFEQLAAAEREVAALDESKHAGHAVASLIREQYIHQAHTIIEGDRSHIDHYEVAARQAHSATRRLLAMPLTPEERNRAEEVQRLVVLVDKDFHEQMLPAIEGPDHRRVHALHTRSEALVNRVVGISEDLNRGLERRAISARKAEERLRQQAVAVVIGCFIAAIAVVVGAWLVIGRSILRRLSELRVGALRLASGDLSARVSDRGTDDLAELATTFNEMAVSIATHQRKLVESQRLAVLGQVAAGVAHEINNPLGVILGYVKLLRGKTAGSFEISNDLRIIEDETRQCQRIVQGLLDLGRPIPARRAVVNLADVARDAIDRLLEAGKLQGRSIETPGPDEAAVTVGDAPALRQVVSNLVLNAIEATSESGTISLRVSHRDGQLELEVEDTGTGIPEQTLRQVLDPFFTTKPSGTGLGLAICQAIASAHEGSLEIQSTLGTGTRVVLRLPGRSALPDEAAE